MKLTPIFYYTDDPSESDTRCSWCERLIRYTHIALDGEKEILLGIECVNELRKSGEIDERLPLRGRYDWKMSDVRSAAQYQAYCASIAHAA